MTSVGPHIYKKRRDTANEHLVEIQSFPESFCFLQRASKMEVMLNDLRSVLVRSAFGQVLVGQHVENVHRNGGDYALFCATLCADRYSRETFIAENFLDVVMARKIQAVKKWRTVVKERVI